MSVALILAQASFAPTFAQTSDPETSADSAESNAPRDPQELLEYITERRVSGPEGEALIVGGVAGGYLMDSRKRLIVEALAKHYGERESDSVRLVFILYSPHSSELLAPDGEDADIAPGYSGGFRRYLHQECYVKIDYDNDTPDEKDAKRRGDVDCYIEHTAEYLSGATLGHTVYSIFGVRLENIPYWNPLAVLALSLTLIGLTLPQMAIYLGLVALLRKSVEHDMMGQRLLKVLTPIAIGLGWFFFWLNLVVSVGHLPGILNSMKAWFWLSGVFFALNFIACMWIADHFYFPENSPPRWWIVALFYIFGPFLLVLGGAAGSAAAGGASAAGSGGKSSASGSGSSSGGAAGRITGGGGTFAGGGASGSF